VPDQKHDVVERVGGRRWRFFLVDPEDAGRDEAEITEPGWYFVPKTQDPSWVMDTADAAGGPYDTLDAAREDLRRGLAAERDLRTRSRVPAVEKPPDPRVERQREAARLRKAALLASEVMRLESRYGVGPEIRGAEGLPPGTYWAVHFVEPVRLDSWLELFRERPSKPDGHVAHRAGDRVQLPDGRLGLVWGPVVKQKNGKVRHAREGERLRAGKLRLVGE
jgi:hypothetical protein